MVGTRKEAQARLKINSMLEASGWRLFDSEKGSANVGVEAQADLGNDFEHTKNGYIDYLLLDDNSKPLVVLEAKRESIAPLSAKEQAREYANSVHARFIILSNGNTHYFWDTKFGNPEPISSFPTQESLKEDVSWQPSVDSLISEEVKNNYIALSQKPDFEQDPSYQEDPKAYAEKNKLKILRDYQVGAIKAIQDSAKAGNTRYLLEMATGTGKTLTCAAIIKLFLKTGNARRVLFLVDRIELENQAEKAFNQSIGNSYTVKIYKRAKNNWNTADIVISTVQSLQSSDRYKDFSPTDFDLIISDEAHRSIGGNARAVFEYFKGFKIGLTATPKDFIKNTGADANSEKDFERRELLDTYKTFGCESGQPTFRYGLREGANDPSGPFLVNPVIVDARTDITSQLLDEKGYAVHKVLDDGNEIDDVFGMREFEKTFFNEKTNEALCLTFLEQAEKDPISGEIGKTLIFAVSQKHAEKIAQILNKIAMERYPGKYESDFAVQITSNVMNAQDYTTQFSENNLRGKTKWLPEYESSRVRVAVTVGMMTTGYDCSDLLNVVFMRPVFSPSDFIQMKGRGTRLHTFTWTDYANNEEIHTAKKQGFKLIDFFAVCEYFEEKYDYNAPLVVPKVPEKHTGIFPPPPLYPLPDSNVSYANERPADFGFDDHFKTASTTQVSSDGMRVDREMFRDFQESDEAKKVKELATTNRDLAKDFLRKEVFDKPNFFISLEKLRKIFGLNRRLDLDEAIDLITGEETKPKDRDAKIKDYFDEFILDKNLGEQLTGELYDTAYEVFDAYIANEQVRKIINAKEFGKLQGVGSIGLSHIRLLGDIFPQIIQYINDYIAIDKLNIGKEN